MAGNGLGIGSDFGVDFGVDGADQYQVVKLHNRCIDGVMQTSIAQTDWMARRSGKTDRFEKNAVWNKQ